MSTTKSMLKSIDFSQLMRAAEGLTQWRVLGLSFLTWLAGGLVLAGGQMLATRWSSMFLSLLFFIVACIVFSAGMSAVGILLQDKAKDVEPRSTMDALMAGLMCVPKFILFGLLILAVMLVLCIVAAIVYFICKIPFLGPILLFVAHPVMVIAASVLFIALCWVAGPLLAPAIWDGRSLKGAVSLVVAVVRTRLVPLVLMLLALYIVISVVALVLFSGFIPGFAYMTAIASAIIGPGMLASVGGMGGVGAMASSGHMVAGTLSTVILFAVLMALTMQVMLMGTNLIYLMVSDGLDEKATEESLEAGIAIAREKARQAQERAREAADKVRHATHTDAPAPAQPAAAPSGAAVHAPAPIPSEVPSATPSATPVVAPVAAAAAVVTGAVAAASAPAAPAAPLPAPAQPETVAPLPSAAPVEAPAPMAAPAAANLPAASETAQAPAVASAPAAPLPRCSNCFDVVAADDVFCEHCGHKLH